MNKEIENALKSIRNKLYKVDTELKDYEELLKEIKKLEVKAEAWKIIKEQLFDNEYFEITNAVPETETYGWLTNGQGICIYLTTSEYEAMKNALGAKE